MLADWETFYLVVGTSAGALVGVMFIVATLTAEIEVDQINRGTVIYQNPTVFHFGAIVAASALALVPEHLMPIVAVLIMTVGVFGLVYSGLTFRRMSEPYEFYQATRWDLLFFAGLPALSYLLMIAGGFAVFAMPEPAAEIIGAGILILLLVSIRNAWDVASFAVRIARSLAVSKKSEKKETAR